ncbi:MAG: isoamylase early set domain-containing protein [Chloroflexales bacterium]|nr:isoamylase early set domain-containing protein [Chloroflexales bacterium]
MITKVPGGPGKVRVTFSMPAAIWADTIHLAGDFNDWSEVATPLRLTEAGWTVTLDLPSGLSFQYRYLINGKDWHNDWQADRYAPNEFGGDNSVVEVPAFLEPASPNHIVSSNGQADKPEIVEFEAVLETPLLSYCIRSAVVVHQ